MQWLFEGSVCVVHLEPHNQCKNYSRAGRILWNIKFKGVAQCYGWCIPFFYPFSLVPKPDPRGGANVTASPYTYKVAPWSMHKFISNLQVPGKWYLHLLNHQILSSRPFWAHGLLGSCEMPCWCKLRMLRICAHCHSTLAMIIPWQWWPNACSLTIASMYVHEQVSHAMPMTFKYVL